MKKSALLDVSIWQHADGRCHYKWFWPFPFPCITQSRFKVLAKEPAVWAWATCLCPGCRCVEVNYLLPLRCLSGWEASSHQVSHTGVCPQLWRKIRYWVDNNNKYPRVIFKKTEKSKGIKSSYFMYVNVYGELYLYNYRTWIVINILLDICTILDVVEVQLRQIQWFKDVGQTKYSSSLTHKKERGGNSFSFWTLDSLKGNVFTP